MEENIGIAGFGFYIPKKRVSVQELGKKAGLPEKVIEYIGAESVSEAESDELPTDMAIKAAKEAIKNSGISPKEIDLIINCPAGMQDYILPPVSGKIQHEIGAVNAVCFDIVQGCCGMLSGVEIAQKYIVSGAYNCVLIVSSDKWSAFTEHHTAEAVIFGDGAGAVVIKKGCSEFFFKDFLFKTEGKYYNLYGINGGGVKEIQPNKLIYKCFYPDVARKEFKKIYTPYFIEVAQKILNKNNLKTQDISYLSMVNANLKLLEVVSESLGVTMDRTSSDILVKYGHIGGFDIFFNIFIAQEQGKIKRGDKILLLNAGIGFTWGSAIIEY